MWEAHDHWELPVDLEWVATVLEGDPMRSQGAFLDLQTGEVIPAFTADPEEIGGDGAANPEAEPDRWLFLPSLGSRAVRQDMAEFTTMIRYRPLRERMELAIEGLGAFHRFRDLIYSEGLATDWHAFSTIGALLGLASSSPTSECGSRPEACVLRTDVTMTTKIN